MDLINTPSKVQEEKQLKLFLEISISNDGKHSQKDIRNQIRTSSKKSHGTRIKCKKDQVEIQIKLDLSDFEAKDNEIYEERIETRDGESEENVNSTEISGNGNTYNRRKKCAPTIELPKNAQENSIKTKSSQQRTNTSFRASGTEKLKVRNNDTMLTAERTTNVFYDTFSTFQRHNEDEEDYDKKVSSLIHQLILEKYEGILKQFRERSTKRQKFWTISQNSDESENDDLGFNSSEPSSPEPAQRNEKNTVPTYKKLDCTSFQSARSLDSGLNNTKISIESLGAHSIRGSSVDYNEQQFLSIALGDEMWFSSTESGSKFLNDSNIPKTNKKTEDMHCSGAVKIRKQNSRKEKTTIGKSVVNSGSTEHDNNENLEKCRSREEHSFVKRKVNQRESSHYYSTPAEFGSYAKERSIGSSNLSTLLSSRDFRKSEEMYSHYSEVAKSEKLGTLPNNASTTEPLGNPATKENDYECFKCFKFFFRNK